MLRLVDGARGPSCAPRRFLQMVLAQHRGAPFGAVASVHSWHAVASFICEVVTVLAHAPVGFHVDDFFGASRAGAQLDGGVMVSIVATLLGVPTDEDKSISYAVIMTVLGAKLVS